MRHFLLPLLTVSVLGAMACESGSKPPPVAGAGGFGGTAGAGATDAQVPMDGSMGGTGGGGGTGATDAEVPIDAGEDAGPLTTGQLTVALENIEDMSGRNALLEVIDSLGGVVAGACVTVTSDPFSMTVPMTLRNTEALCDYGQDTGLPVGEYTVSVGIQEPEQFPPLACATTTASVMLGAMTTATIDRYRPCTGGLPDGVYTASPISCATQSQPIVHTSTDAAAAIMDFRGITITGERNGTQWTETYEDSDCRMEVTREITMEGSDEQWLFSFAYDRTYVWTPSNCTFTATAGGMSAEYGANFSGYSPMGGLLPRPDDIWTYSPVGAGYRFSTPPGFWHVLGLDLPCMMGNGTDEGFVRTWTPR